MDYHRDTKVVLSEDADHKNLYLWFLREIGDKEAKYQRDQIPWQWTQYFTLSEIRSHLSYQLGDIYPLNDERLPPEIKVREFIRAKLLPYDVRDNRLHSSTQYSMFGTNRVLEEFELAIYELEEGKAESCSAWGTVSHTSDIDFRNVTSDDSVTFFLRVTAERFARLLRVITEKSISGGTLRVGGVRGFYSDWSPAISTSNIKVLTGSEKDHSIEIPEGCAILPPRLGEVGEFELYLYDELKFHLPVENSDDEPDDGDQVKPALAQGNVKAGMLLGGNTLSILKSLQIAVWVVAALLFALLLKGR